MNHVGHIFAPTATVKSFPQYPYSINNSQYPLEMYFSLHLSQVGVNLRENPLGKSNTQFRNNSVFLLLRHFLGRRLKEKEPGELVWLRQLPQMAQAQEQESSLTFYCWRVPLGQKKEYMPGGPIEVESMLYLYCQQYQLVRYLSTFLVTSWISALPQAVLSTLPNYDMMPPTCSCWMFFCLLLIQRQLQAWQRCLPNCLLNGQQVWQLSRSLLLYSLKFAKKPPIKSAGDGSNISNFFFSTFLISLLIFLQKGNNNLLLFWSGPMNEYGFFQKFPPVGSLMISYPITLSSPLKYSATFSHMSMNRSFMPFLLVKKSWEKLTTSQERQQWKKDFFMQSYFKGLPQESRRRSTLTGAGKEKESTSQLGNPQPQNFLLQRS